MVHIVSQCFQAEKEYSYRELPNRLEYMATVRYVIDFEREFSLSSDDVQVL